MSPHAAPPDRGARPRAFTLVELLVAMTLLIIITGIVVQITNQTSNIWLGATARIQAFQEARAGFESLTRKLSQATLNTYYDYYNQSGTARNQISGSAALAAFVPYTYDRYSELHFISGQARTLLSGTSITTQTHAVFFQAPLGYSASSSYQELDNALNACGYFLQFDMDRATVPSHVSLAPGYKPRYRFRLMEMTQPTEALGIYDPAVTAASPAHSKDCDWFVNNTGTNSRMIAENVIALVLLPKLPPAQDDPSAGGQGVTMAPKYNYNSRIPLNAATDPTTNPTLTDFPGDSFNAYPMGSGTTQTMTRHAQLPPTMRVVMIVIDETSAARIQGSGTTVPPAIDLSHTTPPLFVDATQLDNDVQKVEDICNAKSGNLTGNTTRLTHRVFNTDIIMRDSKWSNK